MMMQMMQQLIPAGLATELIYSFVIILCSLLIYYSTKEIYKLSSYKGLKYFREAFFFFALVYFFKSFIRFFIFFLGRKEIFEIASSLGNLSLFIFIYASSIAVFYLVYSVMYKKWNHEKTIIPTLHITAVIIALISMITRSSRIILGIEIILFISLTIITFISHKNTKKPNNLRFIYLLILIFFFLNIIDLITPNFRAFQIFIYLFSIAIFIGILYKVLRKVGG